MATAAEIKVVQNATYAMYLEAKKLPPEEAIKVIGKFLRSSMEQEQVAHCEKIAKEE